MILRIDFRIEIIIWTIIIRVKITISLIIIVIRLGVTIGIDVFKYQLDEVIVIGNSEGLIRLIKKVTYAFTEVMRLNENHMDIYLINFDIDWFVLLLFASLSLTDYVNIIYLFNYLSDKLHYFLSLYYILISITNITLPTYLFCLSIINLNIR